MFENYWNGCWFFFFLVNKNVDIVVGEFMVFDILCLKQVVVDLVSVFVDVVFSGSVLSEVDDRKFLFFGSSMKNFNFLIKGIIRLLFI